MDSQDLLELIAELKESIEYLDDEEEEDTPHMVSLRQDLAEARWTLDTLLRVEAEQKLGPRQYDDMPF